MKRSASPSMVLARKSPRAAEGAASAAGTTMGLSALLRLASAAAKKKGDECEEDCCRDENKEEENAAKGRRAREEEDAQQRKRRKPRNPPMREGDAAQYFWATFTRRRKSKDKDKAAEEAEATEEEEQATGILEVSFGSARLLAMDGRQIARVALIRTTAATLSKEDEEDEEEEEQRIAVVKGEGPKARTTKADVFLCPGGSVAMGAKKCVRVRAQIPAEAFASGAVFLAKPPTFSSSASPSDAAAADDDDEEAKKKKTKGRRYVLAAARRPRGFVVPFKGSSTSTSKQQRKKGQALWSPNAPNALVLHVPSPMARNEVAVVVDPRLAQALRPHQREGVRFLYECTMGLRVHSSSGGSGNKQRSCCGGILADGMGLGKTVQAIALVWTLLRQNPDASEGAAVGVARRALVVAPSSLVGNWVKEFGRWLSFCDAGEALRVVAAGDSGRKSLAAVDDAVRGDAEVLVISYDQLRLRVSELSRPEVGIGLVICDEGHRLKNAAIQASQAVAAIPTARRIILSGTPIQNDLGEFFAMVSFVNPGVLGDAATFRKVWEQPILEGREPGADRDTRELGMQRSRELTRITAQFILRRSSAINRRYLPPKTEYTVFCALSPVQRIAYSEIVLREAPSSSDKDDKKQQQQQQQQHADALQVITGLRKLCNHPRLLKDMASTAFPWLPKAVPAIFSQQQQQQQQQRQAAAAPAVAEMIEQSGKLHFLDCLVRGIREAPGGERDKLVIVSNYTQTLDVLGWWCRARRIPFFQLDGKTTVGRRQELVDRFNDAGAPEMVFLLSSKAGGCGLNLVGACHLVMFDPDWNPANDDQAMARVWRDGQKKRVRVYRTLATGTIEERIFQRQLTKLALSAQVVDRKVGGPSSSSSSSSSGAGAGAEEDGGGMPEFSRRELRALFRLAPEGVACDTHDLLGCHCGAGFASADTTTAPKKGTAAPRKPKGRVDARERADVRIDALSAQQHLDDARASGDAVFGRCPPGLVTFLFAVTKDPTTTTTTTPSEASTSSSSSSRAEEDGEFPAEEVPAEDATMEEAEAACNDEDE